MPALTDEDKVIRNDVGKRIAAAIESLSAPEAEKVSYDNTESGMTADNAQDAIDELNTKNNTKMDKTNPTGTGKLSLNRKANTQEGSYSVTTGYNNEASGVVSRAGGEGTQATGRGAIAEAINSQATGDYSISQGYGTIANHENQVAFGQYNVADTSTAASTLRGNYIEIVGNGTNDANRSNARTLDWSGNETLAGDLKINNNQSLSTLWTTLSGLTVLSGKSGSIASFSTDISDKLFSCYVNVVATQAGSGTPAPDNVRAISGWSACNLTGCGKNLFGGKTDGTLFATSIPKGVTLTASMKNNSGAQFRLNLYKADQTIVDYWNVAESTGFKRTFTASEPIEYFSITNTSGTVQEVQVEYGEDKTTYQAYNGTTHTIPFGQTVYGGVLDVLSGVLTVTHGFDTFDGSNDEAWNTQTFSDGTIFFIDVTTKKEGYQTSICNRYQNSDGAWARGSQVGLYSDHPTLPRVYFTKPESTFDTSSTTPWRAWLSNNNVQLCYELATPTTIQLTPTEVKTILGQNNIFGDCGDIDLKYLETIGNRLT